jgi:hypothetical protein
MTRARRAVLAAVIILAAGGFVPWAPSAALAHETAEEHVLEDAGHDPAAEPLLAEQTAAATADQARAASALAAAAVEGDVGRWGPVENWPVVAVHTALLPNGKVLAYDSIDEEPTESHTVHDRTRATVWDPVTGQHTPANVTTGFNIFCSGLAHLPDGSLFVAGGNLDAALHGIVQTHIFNPFAMSNPWSRGPDMAAGRWYPSVTPLPNGEMLITEGGPDMPEVRRTDGGLRALSGASRNLPLYPWLDVAPDGRAFYSGPSDELLSLDTGGTGSWRGFGARDGADRDYGSHAMYDVGKILVAGGGPSRADARRIDVTGATPAVSPTAPMATGRRQHNLTVLADGTVLATGGLSSGASLVDMNRSAMVFDAELWDPATDRWRTLAPMKTTRQYHSTALLMPDGRVLAAGGGVCGVCKTQGYLAKNGEVFSPPYLFRRDGSGALADRPAVESAPRAAAWGAKIEIGTPDAGSIRKVALVRLGAVTHSVDMEQRYVPLTFSAAEGWITADAPRNANIAPPGVYMLFLIDADGVPSVARMITLAANRGPGVSLRRPADGATFTAPATIALEADASAGDGTVSKVEFFDGATKLGEDGTAPYTFDWSAVPAGTHRIAAVVTNGAGATARSGVAAIAVSEPPAPAPEPAATPDGAAPAAATPPSATAAPAPAAPATPAALPAAVQGSARATPAGATPRPVAALRVRATAVRSVAPWAARSAQARRLAQRCLRDPAGRRAACQARARAGLRLVLRWTTTARAAVSVSLRRVGSPRPLGSWRARPATAGALSVPARVQRRLRPGRHRFDMVATSAGATARMAVAFAVSAARR